MNKITKGELFKEGVEYVIIDEVACFCIESIKEKFPDVNLDFYNTKLIYGKKYVKFKDVILDTDFGRNRRLSLSFKNYREIGFYNRNR